jgi:DNA invertase Pin-like site-specific DNA recombinase
MIFTVLGAVAELERNLIQERIHMGLQRARKQGKQLGRRRVIVDREKVRTLHAAGNSLRTIATEMGLTKSTVFNIVSVN